MSAIDRNFHSANSFLAALAPQDYRLLQPYLGTVELNPRQVLAESGERMDRVYFPHQAVVSQMTVMTDGRAAEVASIGAESFVDVAALLDGAVSQLRSIVQVGGRASFIARTRLREAMRRSADLVEVLLRFGRPTVVQLAQNAGCNIAHSVPQRTACWLLMAHDRAGRDSFKITQEFLADMLGVHRPTVTVVARALQAAGAIRYRRGIVTVTDRPALEALACECYRVIRGAMDDTEPPSRANDR